MSPSKPRRPAPRPFPARQSEQVRLAREFLTSGTTAETAADDEIRTAARTDATTVGSGRR